VSHRPDTRPERADAARNRRKVLEAAARVYARRGTALTLDEVARVAGVGVGTVYRRFGDRAGLTFALLDDRLTGLDELVRAGPPPLGPGAPPAQRLGAFVDALLDLVTANAELLLLSEGGSASARFHTVSYRSHHDHLVGLLDQLNPELDAVYGADAVLALVSAPLLHHQRCERGFDRRRVRAGIDQVLMGGWLDPR
jgi:AcrR family transcriptional regulator